MTSNLALRITRFLLSLWLAISIVVPAANAQTALGLNGVYNGKYTCGQGTTNLKLSLVVSAGGDISAHFTFYLPPGTQKQGYTYSLHGQYNPQTAKFSLVPVSWETEHPANFRMVGMNGTSTAGELAGTITGGACSTFKVERDRAESANIASVIAAQKSAATLQAPPPSPAAAAMRAQAPASPRSPASARSPAIASPAAQPKPFPAASAPPAAAPPGSSVKYFCFTTDDPTPPGVYFSDIFDLPAAGSKFLDFARYEEIKIHFQKYLLDKYRYIASTDDPVNCPFADLEPDEAKAVAELVAAKKRSVETETAAAKKQIVETGWKFTETPSTAAAASKPAGQQKAADAVAKSSQKAAEGEKDTDKSLSPMLTSPLLVWRMDSQKDPLTDEVTTKPTATKFVPLANGQLVESVTTTASCGNNGVSVFFLATAGAKDPVPQFAWYGDNSDDSGEQVADVRMRVDGGDVHVAQGYPNKEGRTLYTNMLGLLFYEPNLVARVAQDQEDSTNTGFLALDGLVAPMVRQQARANAQQWAANSAGPLSNLVNARSIRVELPLTNGSNPIFDLNPQDKVLHQFVTDCNARFTGRSQPPPAAPSAAQRRNATPRGK